jgi:outer membrane protein assembly factor BamA
MLYTLGGSGGLKSFRPDLLGGDGTRATLRGFRNYRFRDRDLVFMQAEYRMPLFQHVHATVFVDSGQVAARTSELFKDLRTTTGFSLSYVRKGKTLGRMDLGFGGGEGVQLFWSFGAFSD